MKGSIGLLSPSQSRLHNFYAHGAGFYTALISLLLTMQAVAQAVCDGSTCPVAGASTMDMIYLGVAVACFAATFALLALLERL
jgi:hypothetical protein